MLTTLAGKLQSETAHKIDAKIDKLEAEKHSSRQGDLEEKISGILCALEVECRPVVLYRIDLDFDTGKFLANRGRRLVAKPNMKLLYAYIRAKNSLSHNTSVMADSYDRKVTTEIPVKIFADDIKIYASYSVENAGVMHSLLSESIR
ncbi:hypothetical protein ANCDUO_04371 [Ancylostoma duodenale]|uniref:Uncharacterized protein n=1 Tax=Ancylostoma duodenale TaxID=51022 RepID=A0A0C2H162_9BILA|nr:hypothetical protein ANCDUO_04371 [Ancylostoma duodenale]